MAFKAPEDIERMMAERVAAAQTDAERQEIMGQMKREFTERLSPVALTVENAQDVVIRGIKFTSPGGRIKGGSMTVPILKFDGSRVRMSDCAVVAGPGDGIHILNGSGAEIEKTLVAAVWGTGIIGGPGFFSPGRLPRPAEGHRRGRPAPLRQPLALAAGGIGHHPQRRHPRLSTVARARLTRRADKPSASCPLTAAMRASKPRTPITPEFFRIRMNPS
jgi:hypothetical protein